MVRIKEINIISFGKIENLTLKLNDGLNVIYGSNEAGKSTVQAFIKAIFYGLGKKRKTDAMSDRARFLPWDKSVMSGNIVIDYNDREIEIARRFGKTAAGDKISVTDKISGMVIEELNVSAPGEILFEMSAQMFEKTLWISQNGMYMGGDDKEITAKLTNLSQTHNEEISHIKALEILKEKKAALKAESRRNRNGIIDDIDLRTEELLNAKNSAIARINEKKKLQSEYQILIEKRESIKQGLLNAERAEKLKKNTELVEKADKLREYVSEVEKIKQSSDFKRFDGVEENEPIMLEELYSEKEKFELESAKYEVLENSFDDTEFVNDKKKVNICKISSLVLFIIGVIAFFLYIPAGIILIAVSAAVLTVFISSKRRYTEKTEKVEKLKNDYKEKLNEIISELNKCDEKIKLILQKRRVDNISEYRTYYNKYIASAAKLESLRFAFKNLLKNDNYEELINKSDEVRIKISQEELSAFNFADAEEMRHRLPMIERKLSDIENKLAYEFSEHLSISEIDNEIQNLSNKRKQAVLEHRAVEAAISGIEEAYLSLRTEFGPALNENVNDMISFLTDGKYSDFRVSDTYKLKVGCMGEAKDAEYLSQGTYEQIYLALRLSIINLLCGDNIIAFLDDAFSAFDDKRSKKAMELLKNYSQNSQILLLSCHLRDKKFAEELDGVEIVNLNTLNAV